MLHLVVAILRRLLSHTRRSASVRSNLAHLFAQLVVLMADDVRHERPKAFREEVAVGI